VFSRECSPGEKADLLPAYVQECSGCHVAYPPGLLPGASWQRIMSGLDRHYGTDASIDPAAAQQINAWLQNHTCNTGGRSTACGRQGDELRHHAGHERSAREAPPEDRITRSAWFERKHRRIAPAVWQLPEVKSAANCAACHHQAEQGDFDERSLRLPAGLTPQQRRVWRD
jgi:hypothetical protein